MNTKDRHRSAPNLVVRLSDEYKARIVAQAKERNISVAQLIRDFIDGK